MLGAGLRVVSLIGDSLDRSVFDFILRGIHGLPLRAVSAHCAHKQNFSAFLYLLLGARAAYAALQKELERERWLGLG